MVGTLGFSTEKTTTYLTSITIPTYAKAKAQPQGTKAYDLFRFPPLNRKAQPVANDQGNFGPKKDQGYLDSMGCDVHGSTIAAHGPPRCFQRLLRPNEAGAQAHPTPPPPHARTHHRHHRAAAKAKRPGGGMHDRRRRAAYLPSPRGRGRRVVAELGLSERLPARYPPDPPFSRAACC